MLFKNGPSINEIGLDQPSNLKRYLVVASSTMGMYMAVTHLYAIGPTIQPMEDEFGWSRDEITYSLVIINVIAMLLGPVVGVVIDRYGARHVAIPGALCYLASIAFLSTTGPDIMGWWIRAAVLGVSLSFATSTVWVTGSASHFSSNRGMVIAICLAGASLSAAVTPYITTILTDHYGWRMAYLWLAAGSLVVVLPCIVLWFTDARTDVDNAAKLANPVTGNSRRQILASLQYWQLALTGFLAISGLMGLAVHFVPMLNEGEVERTTAAGIAGLIGMGAIVGRLSCGFLLDRFHGGAIGCIILLLPVIPCLALSSLEGSILIWSISAIVIGLSLGAETDLIAYLATRFFGMKNYGFAFGSLLGFLSLGVGVGPWLGGLFFRIFESYHIFQNLLAGVFVISALLIGLIGRYPTARP